MRCIGILPQSSSRPGSVPRGHRQLFQHGNGRVSASGNSHVPWPHWVKIGNGGGWPVFKFISSDGQLRLFEISFYANRKYYADIRANRTGELEGREMGVKLPENPDVTGSP